MAANLLKHGHGVTVIAHRNRAPVDDLVSKGAREARDMAELAEADVILLCVTTSKVVADTHRKAETPSAAGADHPRFRHLRAGGNPAPGA